MQIILKQMIKSVILSTANVMGPTPQICYPPQDENFKNIVAMKSLILLAGNQDERNITTSIIPIAKDIGLIYLFFIPHPKGRAGIFDASISVVVNNELHELLIKSMSSITMIIKKYLNETEFRVNDDGDIINFNKTIQSLYESIQFTFLNNADPIQVLQVGTVKHHINQFKNSLSDLRKMLNQYE